jgi:geranylgeranyl diphosphate synthase type II
LAFSIFRDLSRQDEVSTELLACATAVEVVHAASLVHDDLPALDNDDFRRGRPACHKAFGEATAVLVGDVLIGEAFSLVVESVTSAEQSVVLVRYLAGTWEKLCAGQQLDLDKSTEGVLIAELKTGALFGFSAACGAICAAINPDDLLAVYDWGVRVGVAFQKLDDIEDGERSRDEKEVVANDFRTLADEISDLLGVETPNTLAVLELIIPVG